MKNNNQINVPQAREAMDRIKMHLLHLKDKPHYVATPNTYYPCVSPKMLT